MVLAPPEELVDHMIRTCGAGEARITHHRLPAAEVLSSVCSALAPSHIPSPRWMTRGAVC